MVTDSKGKARKWQGTPPTHCDICKKPIEESFYDCKTYAGPWGNLCHSCFTSNGVGLGTGKGQLYELKGKDWVKIAG